MDKHLRQPRPKSQTAGGLKIGSFFYSLSDEVLLNAQGQPISLRPQSLQILHQLALYEGQIVTKTFLVDTIWPDVVVTDDSVTQCIKDIRKAIGDSDRTIVRTVPKKGYRLSAESISARPAPEKPVAEKRVILSPVNVALVGLILLVTGAMAAQAVLQRTTPDDLRIAVLPFENQTGDPRWSRLGRGLSLDIAENLAHTSQLGVIGSESAFEASQMPTVDAADWLQANFLIDGEIEVEEETLILSARLIEGGSLKLIWSETWKTPMGEYAQVRDEILHRASASLNGYFWFGALNIAVADQANKKPRHILSAYEEYLMGVEDILWSEADYKAALEHFKRAVEIEPKYARAWMMIGSMLQWIGDVSPEKVRIKLHEESYAAFEQAHLYAPHDGFIQVAMSTAHLAKGNTEAARRSVLRGVEIAPNNPDVLAVAAWQSLSSGIESDDPLAWAQRAISLNPKGPPWHRLGEGIAAFTAQKYPIAIRAMENAPPHHKKFLILAASYILIDAPDLAKDAASALIEHFPEYSLSGDYDLPMNPALNRLFDAAKQAGVPP